MTEPVPLYRGLADYLNKLVDLSKSDKKLNAAIKELAKNMPVANGNCNITTDSQNTLPDISGNYPIIYFKARFLCLLMG